MFIWYKCLDIFIVFIYGFGINNLIMCLKNIGIIFKWNNKFFYINFFFFINLLDLVV